MKKIFSVILLLISFNLLCSCHHENTSKEKTEGEILNDISMAILMADYGGLKSGDIILKDIKLPTSYRDVKISWESSNPEIIDSSGKVTRPSECWIESRDQQGQKVIDGLNDLWPVILTGTYEYLGLKDTHKIIVRVRPGEGYTCNKYRG